MHELDITRTIAREANKECKKRKLQAKEIILELGELSSYKAEPIEFFYNVIKTDFEALKKSKIAIVIKSGKAKCNECQEIFKINDFWDITCPKCETKDFRVVAGEDIRLLKIK